MRSCAYCGRELAPGEVCDCPQSIARRKSKETTDNGGAKQTETGQTYENAYTNTTSYKTGYTQQDSRVKRAWNRHRMKYKTERNAKARTGGGFFRRLWSLTAKTMRSPAESVMNPPKTDIAAIILIAAVMGATLRMCVFFAVTGLSRSPFGLLAALMSFKGAAGYKAIGNGLLTALMGAVSGVILFALYSGIFYFIGRFIMRNRTGFREFSERMIITCIPMTVICLAGLLLAMVSTHTLIILAGCGALCTAILTYEALKVEWINRSSGRVLYAVMLGLFIFISIIYSLLMIGRGI